MSREEIVDLIEERVANGDFTRKELSHAIGKNDTYIYHFVKRGTPEHLPTSTLPTIADMLGVDLALLLPDGIKLPAPSPDIAREASRQLYKVANSLVHQAMSDLGVTLSPDAAMDCILDLVEELRGSSDPESEGRIAARFLVKNKSR